ncbi:hypothetical protein D9M71_301200 [compost metagenome]
MLHGSVIVAPVVAQQAHPRPALADQAQGQGFGQGVLAGVLGIGHQGLRPLQAEVAAGIAGQGEELFAQARQGVEDQGVGASLVEQRQGPHQGHAGLADQCGDFIIQRRHQGRQQGEDLVLVEQLAQGPLGARRVHAGVAYHQRQLPAMDAARLVDLHQGAAQHRLRRTAEFGQRPPGRQQGAEAQLGFLHAGVAVIFQAFEVGGEVGHIAQGHDEARHGRVQAVARRVTAFAHRAGQGALVVGAMVAAARLPLAVGQRQAPPGDVRRTHAAFRAAATVGAVAVGAGHQRRRHQGVGGADPRADLAIGGKSLAIDAPAGRLLGAEFQRVGQGRLDEQRDQQQCSPHGRALSARPRAWSSAAGAGRWRAPARRGGSCSSACSARRRRSAGWSGPRGFPPTGRGAPAPGPCRSCRR